MRGPAVRGVRIIIIIASDVPMSAPGSISSGGGGRIGLILANVSIGTCAKRVLGPLFLSIPDGAGRGRGCKARDE